MRLSLFQQHVQTWKDCTACPLCHTREKVVLSRGKVPCDVLFVGEAPGKNEDLTGIPFIGPAGDLLNQIIQRAVPGNIRYAITNLIACIPLDPDEPGTKTEKPPEESIEACSPRLQEFIRICDPRLIVCVGVEAHDYLTPGYKWSIPLHKAIPLVQMTHPAAILRANIAQRSLAVQRCIVTVHNAIRHGIMSPSEGQAT